MRRLPGQEGPLEDNTVAREDAVQHRDEQGLAAVAVSVDPHQVALVPASPE